MNRSDLSEAKLTHNMTGLFSNKSEESKAQEQKMLDELNSRAPEYKDKWNKNGVIQFKNERIAILHRTVGSQVQFIVAYDDLTKEGCRLMAIDEGQTAGGDGYSGGVGQEFPIIGDGSGAKVIVDVVGVNPSIPLLSKASFHSLEPIG